MTFCNESDIIQLCIGKLMTIYGSSVRLLNSRSLYLLVNWQRIFWKNNRLVQILEI